ncbi:MAG: RagB/SusD family nutrient uptake outer membrane protein [Reichenbachiella sp.]
MKSRILTLLMAVLVLAACEDYLDVVPKTEPLVSDVFANPADIERLLLSSYQPMRWERNAAFGDSYCMPYMYTDARSDDHITENKFFQPHGHGFVIHPDNDIFLTSDNINVEGIWAKFFTGIASSNTVIQGVQEVSDDVLDADVKNLYISEARFLRAFYYFDAVRAFGPVPLFGDAPLDVSDLASLKRLPIEEVYVQIESDLDSAIKYLPTKGALAIEFRASKGAALALKSKVLLYQEKWQASIDAADELIGLGDYELEVNYADNFSIDNEFGVESIFEIHYEYIAGAGTFTTSASSSLALQFFAPNLGAELGGWNYGLVFPELRDAFATEGDDVRRSASLIEVGTDLGSPRLEAAQQSPVTAGPIDYVNSNGDGGPRYGTDFVFPRKHFMTPEDLQIHSEGRIQESALNHKVIRLSDVYLMLAEATLNGATSSVMSGQEAFDLVRSRVNLPSKPLTMDALKLERRLELSFEGSRFYDLLRWGEAASEIEGFLTGKDELLPIPYNDILITGKDSSGEWVLAQNPGYN